MPTPIDADDQPLELPPTDGGLDSEDVADADDVDADDGDDHDDDHESIGLDVSVGFDQDGDLADLIEDLGSDAHAWTVVSEVGSDQVLIDARDLSDTDADENGWTTDNDAAGDAVAHRDDELDDGHLPLLGSDAGGEGFAEDSASSSDNDDADLPPMDAGEGDFDSTDAASFDASLLGRLDSVGGHEMERLEVTPGVYWPYFSEANRTIADAVDAPIGTELLQVGTQTWLWGRAGAINLDAPIRETLAVAEPELGATSAVADPGDASLALSGDRGIWRLDADGITHNLGGPSADPAMIANATLAFTHDGRSGVLWAQSRLGSLFTRLSDPARWSLVDSPRPGRQLASDGRRSLAYVHAAPNRPCALVQSQDGGASWLSRTIPVSDASLVERVLVCRDVVVLVCDSMTAPVIVSVGDEDPVPLIDGLRAPVALVHESSEVALYGCVVTSDRVLLIRQALGRPRRKPAVITAWAEPNAAMPVALSASYRNGVTHLQALHVRDGASRVQRISLEIEQDGPE